MSLIVFLLFLGGVVAPYPLMTTPEGESAAYGYELASGWTLFRLTFAAFAVLFLVWALGLRRPVQAPILEIGTDAIHWAGTRGKERTIARGAVQSTNVSAYYLNFKPAIDERIPEIPILVFGYKQVEDALERHGWNVE